MSSTSSTTSTTSGAYGGSSGGPQSVFTSHKIIPDSISSAPPNYAHVVFPNGKQAHNGDLLTVAETQQLPQISFPTQPGQFYTVMMIDPDAPSNSDPKWRHYLHYLNVNVPAQANQPHSAHVTGGGSAPSSTSGTSGSTGGGLLGSLMGTSSSGTSGSTSSSSQAAAGSSPGAPVGTHATSGTTAAGSHFGSGSGDIIVTGTTGTLGSGTSGTHVGGTSTATGVTSSHDAHLGHHNVHGQHHIGSGPHGAAGQGSFINLQLGNTLTSYSGPAPPEHTGPHRYIILVYHQTAGHVNTSIFNWEWSRASWNLNEWLQKTFQQQQPQLHAGNFFTAQNEKQGGKPSY